MRKARVSWVSGAPCLLGRGAPGSMMCGSFFLQRVLLPGRRDSVRPGGIRRGLAPPAGGRAVVYGFAVPTEAGGPTGRAGSSDITKIAAAGLFFW